MKQFCFTFACYLALAITFTAAPGLAQDSPVPSDSQATPDDNAQRRSPDQIVDRLASRLNLTDDQKSQILPIITDRQQKLQTLRADTSMRRRKKMRQMKSILEESDTKINAILNDQQKQQYAQMEQQMREQIRERRHDRETSD